MELLIPIGVLIAVVGNIWFLVEAFRESSLWGLGCIVLPPLTFVFLAHHWEECWKPFMLVLVGVGLVAAGAAAGGHINAPQFMF